MKILAFDTSLKKLSACLWDGTSLYEASGQEGTHAKQLLPSIDALLKRATLRVADIELLAPIVGPGSYTGTRIAVSTAKMFAFAIKMRLLPVTSLQALAEVALTHDKKKGVAFLENVCAQGRKHWVLSLMDAKNDRVYSSLSTLEYRQGAGLSLSLELEEKARDFEDLLNELEALVTQTLVTQALPTQTLATQESPKETAQKVTALELTLVSPKLPQNALERIRARCSSSAPMLKLHVIEEDELAAFALRRAKRLHEQKKLEAALVPMETLDVVYLGPSQAERLREAATARAAEAGAAEAGAAGGEQRTRGGEATSANGTSGASRLGRPSGAESEMQIDLEQAEIRALKKADAPLLLSFLDQYFPDFWSKQTLEASLGDEQNLCLGLFGPQEAPELLAFLIVHAGYDLDELDLIVVHPKYRRKGLATRLFVALQSNRKQRVNGSQRALDLEVSVKNASALAFYKSRGFTVQRRRKDYYGAGEDALVLRLEV